MSQTKTEPVQPVDFDKILSHAGQFGIYQASRFAIMGLAVAFGAMQILQLSFTGATPEHRCRTVCDGNSSEYDQPWLHGAVPYEDGKPSQCYMYSTPTCDPHHDPKSVSKETVKCTEWVYDDSMYKQTAVTDFDMVCERSYLAPLSSTILMCGELTGSFVFGFLSDKIGRKNAQVAAVTTAGIVGVLKAVIPTMPVHIIFCLLCSSAGLGVQLAAHVELMEIVGEKWRNGLAVLNQIAFSIGEIMLGILAIGLRKWRNLQFIMSLPFFALAPLMFWLLPESPRWLVMKGKWQEARRVTEKIAEGNGRKVPEELLPNEANTSMPIEDEHNSSESIAVVFKRPKLRIITLVIFFDWFVIAMLFYGMSFNISNVEGVDPFIIFFITMAAEIPGDLLAWYLMDKIGRKPTIVSFYLIAGIACVAAGAVYEVNVWASVALSLVGKACVAGNFSIMFIYTGEIFPTFIRGSAIGAASMAARPGSISAPYIAFLGDIKLILPLCIFGGLGLCAGLLSWLTLPETRGRGLPETLEEAETFKNLQNQNETKDPEKLEKKPGKF